MHKPLPNLISKMRLSRLSLRIAFGGRKEDFDQQ
jgi:hypothetical protein